jgi:hypothetical protein
MPISKVREYVDEMTRSLAAIDFKIATYKKGSK